MSSFMEKVLKYNKSKKEGPESPKRKRAAPSYKAPIHFRREKLNSEFVDDVGVIEEAPGAYEVVQQNVKDFNVFENVDDEVENDVTSDTPFKRNTKKLCVFTLGEMMLTATEERLPAIKKSVADMTRGRLDFDYSQLKLLMEHGSPEGQMMAAGLAGLMTVMEAERNRQTVVKNDTEEKLMTSLEPAKFGRLPLEPLLSLDGESEFVANDVLMGVKPMKSSVKNIVYHVTNFWISQIIHESFWRNFSVSDKPKLPQVSLPARFINTPVYLLSKCIQIEGLDEEKVATLVSSLFMRHATYLFENARKTKKNGEKAKISTASGKKDDIPKDSGEGEKNA